MWCLKSYENNNKIGTQFLAQLSKRVKMIVLNVFSETADHECNEDHAAERHHKRKRVAIYIGKLFFRHTIYKLN